MSARPLELWRVFPWDVHAPPGRPYSPSFIPPPTGRGRFDLPRDRSSVLYLAESPDHAVGEALQAWRGRRVSARLLKRAGLPLSLVSATLSDQASKALADLCDPEVVARVRFPPDRLASRHRSVTQPLSASLWESGYSGLRWWSRFWGDWHTVVLFTARLSKGVTFGTPRPLTIESPAVIEAASLLGIELA